MLGLVEVNVNWRNTPVEHRLRERTLMWWETSHIVAAHDMNDEKNDKQE